MPISVAELKRAITPNKTALLLGAGASIPSGAPSGTDLAAKLWKQIANSDPSSDDLTETASILVRRFTRRAVVDAVIEILKPLKPTGGLLGLPKFDWSGIFTTNYDRLLEGAFKQNQIVLAVYRSNYDFTSKENVKGTKLYKIHGCITQDESLGDRASMILTESDYETHKKYRQSMFSLLQTTLLMGDVLIIGQSLRDRHLNDLVKEVLAAKQDGSPGQIYMLVFEKDDLRAPLLEDKGVRIAFGGIDEFVHALSADFVEKPVAQDAKVDVLPLSLVSTVHDVKVEVSLKPNVKRMFNGGPATYADIHSGVTFERVRETELVDRLIGMSVPVVVVTGAAGVGKTTFARRLLTKCVSNGLLAWEHRTDFALNHHPWISIEAQLRSAGQKGVLLLDECTHFMRSTNILVDYLSGITDPALSLVVTANSAQWAPRMKSPNFFSKGTAVTFSALADSELYSLVNLVEHNREIANLVHSDFKRLPRQRQLQALRQKCSADMFVCLSNIFANENLDIILLQEYEALDPALQEYYRFVAALEAVGTRVHRQLVIRMLRMNPTNVQPILNGLTGIVDEYDIRPSDGIYGWSTRHVVIARKIAEYKFSSLDDLKGLFDTIIDNINPAVSIELQSIRAICDAEYGIGRIGDTGTRQVLYRKLIDAAPAERIPWHRLIRELLSEDLLDEAEYTIRESEEAVGADAPIDRYKVRLLVVRARTTPGISDGDRLAILRRAYEQALLNTDRHSGDKHSFRELCNVAVEMVKRGESVYILDEALERMRSAAERILDPEMLNELRQYEVQRARLH